MGRPRAPRRARGSGCRWRRGRGPRSLAGRDACGRIVTQPAAMDIWRPRARRSSVAAWPPSAVLLAEHEPDSREYLERQLRDDGFVVFEAAWTARALDLAERLLPDVVIAGEPELCRRLRAGEPGRSLGPQRPGDRPRPSRAPSRSSACGRSRAVPTTPSEGRLPRAARARPRAPPPRRRSARRRRRGRAARRRPPRPAGAGRRRRRAALGREFELAAKLASDPQRVFTKTGAPARRVGHPRQRRSARVPSTRTPRACGASSRRSAPTASSSTTGAWATGCSLRHPSPRRGRLSGRPVGGWGSAQRIRSRRLQHRALEAQQLLLARRARRRSRRGCPTRRRCGGTAGRSGSGCGSSPSRRRAPPSGCPARVGELAVRRRLAVRAPSRARPARRPLNGARPRRSSARSNACRRPAKYSSSSRCASRRAPRRTQHPGPASRAIRSSSRSGSAVVTRSARARGRSPRRAAGRAGSRRRRTPRRAARRARRRRGSGGRGRWERHVCLLRSRRTPDDAAWRAASGLESRAAAICS